MIVSTRDGGQAKRDTYRQAAAAGQVPAAKGLIRIVRDGGVIVGETTHALLQLGADAAGT